MELKEYQSRTLEAFGRWLEALETARVQSETVIAALRGVGADIPEDVRNYPKSAWRKLAETGNIAESAGEYVGRTDNAGRPIPNVCFKIPTGGGKTLLAAAALERLNRTTGLTLWLVPSRAIYQQTRAALWNREHPYRQMLERASGGRVKMLEKDDPFTKMDVANYLCVMLLMLPAANRQRGRDFLRMFRDSGRYPTLFPDSDDPLGDARLLNDFPDLERVSENGPVKHSLFNVFKTLRPVVVLDEAHKAYGARSREANIEFSRSVSRLDPSLVIELSATPNPGISNLLVDVSGVDLKNEEMIKLPVRVTSIPDSDWRHTLAQAFDELERLDDEAQSLNHSEGQYIRPIALVRVERTGRDQLHVGRVHAEDVREYLNVNLGVPAEAIRVKSADNDELRNEDLLSELSQVRWIITRSALMEGWDCPFAYLLVMLDNTRAQRAITQLVGRVMRQPHARRTGREALDHCYVYCCNADVGVAVEQVKNGLEQEGLTGLGDDVRTDQSGSAERVTIRRRSEFRGQNIFLPRVLHRDGDDWIELDYQRHILPSIDWGGIHAPNPQSVLPQSVRIQTASVDVGDSQPSYLAERELDIERDVTTSYFARRLSDIVPNPWQAARVARDMIRQLRDAGESEDRIYNQRSYQAFALRTYLTGEVERQAENVFRDKLTARELRFDLEASSSNYRMTDSYEILVGENEGIFHNRGKPIQFSLFEPLYQSQFDSTLESRFARYLDEQKALTWWHRVAARQRNEYYLRGWKRERIWPDFIAMAGQTEGKPHLLVFETKDRHLDNPDTDYKRRVFETLENAFNVGSMTICDGPARGAFRLVFSEEEFPAAMANLKERYNA